MDTAAEILVIILSVVLAVFLILAIILVIYLIRVSAEIRRMTESARRAVDTIETTVEKAGRFVSPAVAAHLFGKYLKRVIRNYTKEKK